MFLSGAGTEPALAGCGGGPPQLPPTRLRRPPETPRSPRFSEILAHPTPSTPRTPETAVDPGSARGQAPRPSDPCEAGLRPGGDTVRGGGCARAVPGAPGSDDAERKSRPPSRQFRSPTFVPRGRPLLWRTITSRRSRWCPPPR